MITGNREGHELCLAVPALWTHSLMCNTSVEWTSVWSIWGTWSSRLPTMGYTFMPKQLETSGFTVSLPYLALWQGLRHQASSPHEGAWTGVRRLVSLEGQCVS